MPWVDLGIPRPKPETIPYSRHEWLESPPLLLEVPVEGHLPSFSDVLSCRRTRRHFGRLDSLQLASFLWYSCRVIQEGDPFLGFPLSLRPVPSAGAIHPVHCLVDRGHACLERYDPLAHGLTQLNYREELGVELRRATTEVLSPEDAVILLFIAEPGMTEAKYDFSNSLVWRDVGVLIGHMALVAEALGLSFCPLGITGEPWAGKLSDENKLVGVGMALLGATPGA